MIDRLIADVLVWGLVTASWLAVLAPGLAVGAGLAWWWQWRRRGGLRDQKAAVRQLAGRCAELTDRAADAELAARLDREAAAASRFAVQRAHARAEAMAQDVVALQHQLAAANDQLVLAPLDATTEWELDQK